MVRKTSVVLVGMLACALFSGCSGTGGERPPESTTTASPSIDGGGESETALVTLDGEWVATRTVTDGNASSDLYTVGHVEDRLLAFTTSGCDASCSGTVLSGATLDGRSSTTFEQSDEAITFEYEGFNDCFDIETGALLFTDGYEYVLSYELAVETTEGGTAIALGGTALLSYVPTAPAIAAGCETDTGRVAYTVTVERA